MVVYAAIDPMAMILSSAAYLRWIEWKHPHVPKVEEIAEFLRAMTPDEKEVAVSRAKSLAAYGKAVEQAAAEMLK
jgi:predicted HAD superfamily Cof-like phosphohydrolase